MKHRSWYELVGRIPDFDQETIKRENPVFAAGKEFFAERGGPISRAFLDALPDEWRMDYAVIDSMLVWLRPPLCPGIPEYHSEIFPGRIEGVMGEANKERTVEHIACCVGSVSLPEFIVGDVEFIGIPDDAVETYWNCCENLTTRHEVLKAMVADGRVSAKQVDANTLYRYGWGCFYREMPATDYAFRLFIRASRNTQRPICNGLRNATTL